MDPSANFSADTISHVGKAFNLPIYVSSFQASNNVPELKRRGISTVIRCRTPYSPRYFDSEEMYQEYAFRAPYVEKAYAVADITQYVMTLNDNATAPIGSFFRSAIDVIERSLKSGTAVLVHCDAGVSRSVTIVIAYLIWRYAQKGRDGIPAVSAILTDIRISRPIANPNPGFIKLLNNYRGAWLKKLGKF